MTRFGELDQARTKHRLAAQHALRGWFDGILETLQEVSARCGVSGGEPAVLFAATSDESTGDEREELESITLVTLTSHVVLRRGDRIHPQEWEQGVQLWSELRECLGQMNAEPLEASILLDPENRLIATWDPFYCPDLPNDPVLYQAIPTLEEQHVDPFEDLLSRADSWQALVEGRVERLLRMHSLTAPGRPGHAAGDCWG